MLALNVSTGQNSVNIICVSLRCGLVMFLTFCSFCHFISHNKVTIVVFPPVLAQYCYLVITPLV